MTIKATYEQLIQRIAKLAAIEVSEVERRVEAKRAKLSGLISKEGAAQVVAAELGISFDKQRYKISDLLPGMRKIELIGKVLSIFPIRTYLKGGTPSKVANMILADETSNIRIVLWDTHHIAKIESNEIKQGTVVEIKNADVRGNENKEVHLGSLSEIVVSDKEIKNVITSRQQEIVLKRISELNINENAKIKGAIVQIFQPKFFNVCPECNMKVSVEEGQFLCPRHGNIVPRERMLVNLIVDDGSENINAIGFNELVDKLFEMEPDKLKDSNLFLQKKQELLAKEFFFLGRARKNMLFNRDEFILNDIEEAVPEKIIEQFEK